MRQHEKRSEKIKLQLPILVYGLVGSGASILIWTIKKILWPDLHTDNPLCSRNSAHNQPLCQHWHGDIEFFTVYSGVADHERVLHIDPNPTTLEISLYHPCIFVHNDNEISLQEAAILAKHKCYEYYKDQSIDELTQRLFLQNRAFDKTFFTRLPHVLYLNFRDVVHDDLDRLLDKIYTWLDREPGYEQSIIKGIHQRWRIANRCIWEEYHVQ